MSQIRNGRYKDGKMGVNSRSRSRTPPKKNTRSPRVLLSRKKIQSRSPSPVRRRSPFGRSVERSYSPSRSMLERSYSPSRSMLERSYSPSRSNLRRSPSPSRSMLARSPLGIRRFNTPRDYEDDRRKPQDPVDRAIQESVKNMHPASLSPKMSTPMNFTRLSDKKPTNITSDMSIDDAMLELPDKNMISYDSLVEKVKEKKIRKEVVKKQTERNTIRKTKRTDRSNDVKKTVEAFVQELIEEAAENKEEDKEDKEKIEKTIAEQLEEFKVKLENLWKEKVSNNNTIDKYFEAIGLTRPTANITPTNFKMVYGAIADNQRNIIIKKVFSGINLDELDFYQPFVYDFINTNIIKDLAELTSKDEKLKAINLILKNIPQQKTNNYIWWILITSFFIISTSLALAYTLPAEYMILITTNLSSVFTGISSIASSVGTAVYSGGSFIIDQLSIFGMFLQRINLASSAASALAGVTGAVVLDKNVTVTAVPDNNATQYKSPDSDAATVDASGQMSRKPGEIPNFLNP